MPAFFPTNTLSDIASKYDMNALEELSTTILVSLTANQTLTFDFITNLYYPNNNSYTAATATVVLVHTVINAQINVSAQLHRVNSAGVIQSSGTASVAQANAATNTFTGLAEPTWSTVCSDRLMLRLTYVNTQMANRSCTLGTDRSGTYLLASIPNNGGTCAVLRKPTWVTGRS